MGASAQPYPHPYGRPERAGAVALVSPLELKALLASADPPQLLDVRPSSERAMARFPGDRHVPLFELPQRYRELSPSRPIVAYDQFGSQARRAIEYLQRKGFPVVGALEGGIDEYARIIDPSIPRYQAAVGDDDLILRQFPRVDSGCLTYLIADPVDGSAIVVDPGREIDPYLQAIHEGNWKLRAIVETHTHADHLAGHSALAQRTDAPIYVSHRSPAEYPRRPLTEGEELRWGSAALQILETPGHTRDHLTLQLRDRVFTGDTLLIGACGRTDLGDGSPEALYDSLFHKLLKLPDDVEVLPAHFGRRHALIERYSSSIGFERATNEALNQGSYEAFQKYMTEGWPPKPAEFDRIVHENLVK